MKDAWTDAYLNVAAYGGDKRTISFFKPNFTRKSLEFTTGPDTKTATVFITNFPKNHPVIVDHFELIESPVPRGDELPAAR
ncbi:hypothetical protein N9B73_03340 [Verrucomicrobiales bacterium]|jgi:hypothetical protein|nr:hypothetical protein [Verrucomicrobiales bacterium]